MAACTRCGMQLPPSATTCTGCGLPLGTSAQAPTVAVIPAPLAPTAQPAPPPPAPPQWAPPPPPYGALPTGPPAWVQPAPGGFPGYPAPWATQPTTNGLAIGSLVCGVFGILGITAIASVAMGHVARAQIRERGERGSGLAFVGLIFGYLWVLAFAVAIAIPVFITQRHPNQCLPCMSQGPEVFALTPEQNATADVRDMATSETRSFADTGHYTSNMNQLEAEQFAPERAMVYAAGTDARKHPGYCLITGIEATSTWYVFDSQAGGLSPNTYSSENAAKDACAVKTTVFGHNLVIN